MAALQKCFGTEQAIALSGLFIMLGSNFFDTTNAVFAVGRLVVWIGMVYGKIAAAFENHSPTRVVRIMGSIVVASVLTWLGRSIITDYATSRDERILVIVAALIVFAVVYTGARFVAFMSPSRRTQEGSDRCRP